MVVRRILPSELKSDLFSSFIRHQIVTDCWRREGQNWVIRRDAFIDDWSDDDYAALLDELRDVMASGRTVIGAFVRGTLKGFAAIDGCLRGALPSMPILQSCMYQRI